MTDSEPKVPSFDYIETQKSISELIGFLEPLDRVAIDTEADSLHHYHEKTCLIQISGADRHFLVDPLAEVDLRPLLKTLRHKPLVLHGADYDLRMLRRGYGFIPTEIFDTVVASQMLGYESFGLAALVERHFGVELPKSSQRADWSRRPLPPDMLAYAVNDTSFLMPLSDILEEELRGKGRVDWRIESCQRLIEESQTDREVDPDERWRIRGWRKLKPRQTAILKEIWHWREHEAERVDRPPFKIVHNETLLNLSVWADEKSKADVSEFPKLPRNLNGRKLQKLGRAVEKARSMEESDWPTPPSRKPRKRPDPDTAKRAEILRKTRNELAEELGLDVGVLAPNSALTQIAGDEPDSADDLRAAGDLMSWQTKLVFQPCLDALQSFESNPEQSESA